MVNREKIKKLAKYEGFQDLIEHFREEAGTAIANAHASTSAEMKLRYLTWNEVFMKVVSFLQSNT